MPMQRSLYAPDWELISLAIRERAEGRCEWCAAEHGQPHPVTGSRVVLTVAHLNHEKLDNREVNLAALCQRCHLNHDREQHELNRRRTLAGRLAAGQRDLFGPGEAAGLGE